MTCLAILEFGERKSVKIYNIVCLINCVCVFEQVIEIVKSYACTSVNVYKKRKKFIKVCVK